MVGRKLGNWIDAFIDYTEILPSPRLWRKWSAISAVAGALERKVWTYTLGSNLYPNQYIFLIGPPGTGKSVVTSVIQDLWAQLEDHKQVASSLSRASFIDALRDADRKIVRPKENPPVVSFNALSVATNELGVLLSQYDNDFISVLTDLYDCKRFGERKRTKDLNFTMDHTFVNLLAGGTPDYLHHLLPEGAWDQGFMSRVMVIYTGEVVKPPLFSEERLSMEAQRALVYDLKIIGQLYGKMKFSVDAGAAITAWYDRGGPPIPDHPKLKHYISRRTAKLLKLCMVASACSSDELIITLEHYQLALDWLIEAEGSMLDVFKDMGSGGEGKIADDTWHYIYTKYIKTKQPIPESDIINFVQQRIPSHSVERFIKLMEKAGAFASKLDDKGMKVYIPKAKKDF